MAKAFNFHGIPKIFFTKRALKRYWLEKQKCQPNSAALDTRQICSLAGERYRKTNMIKVEAYLKHIKWDEYLIIDK